MKIENWLRSTERRTENGEHINIKHINILTITLEKYKEQQEQDVELLDDSGCKLVVHNDDYHTFDYVIKALVDICRHTYEQAEQCTIMIHYTGKCIVKTGGYEELLPMHTALLNKQLTSEIIQ